MRVQAWIPNFFVILAVASGGAAQQSDDRPGVAVFPFENGVVGMPQDDREAFGIGLQQQLLTELAMNSTLRIVERNILQELIEEQNRSRAGQIDARTAAAMGKVVGAKYVILGAVSANRSDYRITGRIIDTETSEILKADRVQGKQDDVFSLMVDLSERIVKNVNLPPLPPQVREARRQREIPGEAVMLYSRALVYQDRGHKERALELYQQIVDRFPQYTEAKEAKERLESAGQPDLR